MDEHGLAARVFFVFPDQLLHRKPRQIDCPRFAAMLHQLPALYHPFLMDGQSAGFYIQVAPFQGNQFPLPQSLFQRQQENGQIQVEGVFFQVLALPGHAASHVGFVTPDGVAYLADSVLSPDPSGREHLTYMLDWSRSFQTLEAVRRFSYQSYILAHGGVYDRIGPVAEENLERFRGMMDGFCRLFAGELTQEEVLAKAAKQYHFTWDSYEKVCVLERVVRSMTEYLVEQGRIGRRSRGGVMVYGPWKPE